MGRQQTFDTAEVVRAARTVFWQHGYEDASIPDLEAATGLKRSSIYNAFDSKRGLFDAAVSSYLDEVVRPRLRPLTVAQVSPDAIVEYFSGLRAALELADSFTAENGCLLINAAGGPIAHDDAVRESVAAYRAELQAAVRNGIEARHPGRPADEVDRLAETCTALLVATFALTRVDADAALGSLDAARRLVD
ncbi:TetR/AcrR family transcriptional regulator [Agromyces cerinus]|uniref:Transcriptional regulator, TetR family n=1 Tax=Agromyces cerinus subsp. cerinus TaxID=232089 RepID=A0A1N6E8E5_9MICO|nr:TetR/AcrR family transcriptional regulator [Agromyces cerinus]SIN79187.1 transcriptional regulator, TetR family [Agromyces cerinus subsp. cerinus]